ncbi:MAG: hypothetical protein ACREP9_21190, partial [Candidatus Dormibacteraceae bacterium]
SREYRPNRFRSWGKISTVRRRYMALVTTADVAGTGAKSGAWVGGLFGVLTGAALLFVPAVGALVVLGPLAAGALAATEGAVAGGGLGAVLGHFIAKKHVPKYSDHLQAGNYLVLRHQGQASDVQKLQQDTTPVEVDHHEDLITATQAGPH